MHLESGFNKYIYIFPTVTAKGFFLGKYRNKFQTVRKAMRTMKKLKSIMDLFLRWRRPGRLRLNFDCYAYKEIGKLHSKYYRCSRVG